MDFLIVADARDSILISRALAAEPTLQANIQTAGLMSLAHRHLLYGTPDVVVVIGEHDPQSLARLSDLVDVMGCDQIMADSLMADFVVMRRCGTRPYSEPRHAGVAVQDIVVAMAARHVACRALASRQTQCRAVPA